ncbi:MAG: hypothetical protein ACFFDF_12110 [Candidatus Odinarchaeota archaeon]
MCIPNSETRAFFKKKYAIIFILGIILLLTGFVLASVGSFIPPVNYGDPGYEDYIELISNLQTFTTLFLNLGIGLFLLANFVGAMTDKRFSIEIKRGMLIASFLGIIALVIFNYLILYFIIS